MFYFSQNLVVFWSFTHYTPLSTMLYLAIQHLNYQVGLHLEPSNTTNIGVTLFLEPKMFFFILFPLGQEKI